MTAAKIASLDDEAFRAGGLSRPKVRTLRALAAAVADGLDLDALAGADPETVRARLTAVPGIGPWTADIYLMFCIGHRDTFAPGDLALQVAAQRLMKLPSRPTARELDELAMRWTPWRGVAARVLWAYYATIRSSPGQPV
jgi:DNA-3-methyladenine glycosylase II